jgi:hypothetical protein
MRVNRCLVLEKGDLGVGGFGVSWCSVLAERLWLGRCMIHVRRFYSTEHPGSSDMFNGEPMNMSNVSGSMRNSKRYFILDVS